MATPLNVLIVEDSQDDADLLADQLSRSGYAPKWTRVETEPDFLAGLKKLPDIVLSDYSMPCFSGLRAAELLQQSGLNIPFILISGTVGEDIAVDAMKHGASDYLLKDRIARLGAAVGRALEQKRLRDERKRSDAELRFQKLLLEAQSEASIDGILTVDTDGRIISFNRRFMEMWGISQEVLAACEDGPVLKSVVGRVVNPNEFLNRVRYLYEHRDLVSREEIVLKDGSVFDRYTSPVKGPDGAYYGRIWTFRDITERKRAEESLSLFRALIDRSNDGIEIIDPETGRFLDVNETTCRRLGYSREEMLSMGVMDVSMIVSSGSSWQAEQAEIRRTGFRIVEGMHRRKDGTTFPVEVNVRLIRLNRDYMLAVVRDITERKRAEEELRFQKMLLEAQSEVSIDGILTVDVNDSIISFNKRFAELWGVPEELVAARSDGPVLEFVGGRVLDPRQFLDRVRYLYDHRELISREEIALKDGRVFDRYTSPVTGPDGAYYGRIWTFRDITERKRAEEELRQRKDDLAEAQRVAKLGSWRYDITSNKVRWSEELFRIFGVEVSRFEGTHEAFLNSVIPDDRPKVLQANAEAAAHGTSFEIEYRIQTQAGDLKTIQEIGRAKKDAGGKVVELFGTAQDITERKRATEQVTKQAALLNQTRDAITVRNLEGRFLFWNKGAEKIFGWSGNEVVGRTMFDLLKDDTTDIEKMVDEMLREGEWSGELQKTCRDGSKVTVDARWTLVRDAAGNPESILAIDTDITERKKIEAQFLRAQRMESIGTLASGVAHDLNNILSPILMAIEMLKDMPEGEQKQQMLQTIQTSAERGASIVQQVLSFGRGMEGKRVDVQIKHLLKDIQRIVRDTFPKDIRFRSSAPRDAWVVSGDPTQLYQVLLNLCVNARDAMPNGGELFVGVENSVVDAHYAVLNPHVKAGPYVLVEVTDSGSGITPEVIDRIFDPFFTTKELGKGTGLGLSTALAIVKSHGGFLDVYSEPGKGTTFRIYFPALESMQKPEAADELAALPRGNGETILVADDESSILTITRQTLEAFGYRVLSASNGVEAVAIYAQHAKEVAVVLTDMMMPLMDGSAVILALRAINPKVRIIAASGLNSNGKMVKAPDAGVKHFLPKPYNARTLLEALRKAME